jgi:hypothetical protein
MKKIAFIITLWLALCSLVQAQADTSFYRPFPTGYAVWEYSQRITDFTTNKDYYDHLIFHQCGDTVVNGVEYRKIYEGGGTSLEGEPLPSIEKDTAWIRKNLSIYALIREDTNRKVYCIDIRDNLSDPPVYTERLLYDFRSAETGDTLSLTCYQLGVRGFKETDSMQCYSIIFSNNNQARFAPFYDQGNRQMGKMYRMRGFGNCPSHSFGGSFRFALWLEGIGTTFSPLFESTGRVYFEQSPIVLVSIIQNKQRCRFKSESITSTNLSCLCSPVSRPSEYFSNNQAKQIAVHPNPIASGQMLSIHAPAGSAVHGPYRMELFNLQGQLVVQYIVADLNAGIPIELAPGFYTGQLMGATAQPPLTFKLIVE